MSDVRRKHTVKLRIRAALLAASALCTPAFAAQSPIAEAAGGFDVVSGDLDSALKWFTETTGVSLIYDNRLVEGETAADLYGEYDYDELLIRLLSNTNLEYRKIDARTWALVEKPIVDDLPVASRQEEPPAENVREVIIVTGTRIESARLISAIPQFSVGASEFDSRGTTRVEDMLNALPQAFAAQTTEVSNGATGTSTVNLRGLGSVRTLVLIDGKRLPFGSSLSSAANLDIVPAQLVERVDVVTGGQSAVYGSDAVGGVVNFILKRNFEGFEFDGQAGFYQDGNGNDFAQAVLAAGSQPIPGATTDGRDVFATVTLGANTPDGRGNVTAFLSYQNQNAILQSDHDVSACALGAAPASPTSIGGVGCVGSSSFRRFLTRVGDLFLSDDNEFVPMEFGPSDTYNFGPLNYFQRPNERFNFNAMMRYEIANSVEAYLDMSFLNNNTTAQVAESGSFFRAFQVNCDNPYLTTPTSAGGTIADALGCDAAAIAAGDDVPLFFGYRNVEGGPRQSIIDLTTWRLVGGLQGDLGANWSWDVYGQFSKTLEDNLSKNDINFANAQDALFAVDDGLGNVVCRSGESGCAPWNVFQRPGGQSQVTQDAVNYIQGAGIVVGDVTQTMLGGMIQGDLGVRSPWAEESLQSVFSAEWRRDRLQSIPDDISQIPGGLGFTGTGGATLPVQGEVSVKEIFGEMVIPLAQGRPFFDELGVTGAYRFSDYKSQGNGVENTFSTHTFAAGLTWSPAPDIRVRGQYQRAVRAPNVIDLYTGKNTQFFVAVQNANGLFDPCAGPTPAATAAQCAFTGVTAAQYGSIPGNVTSQFNAVTGGNPQLEPEKSDTYTAGVVLTPYLAPGLQFSADYFDISIADAIATVPPQMSLNQCIDTGDPRFCDLIVRDRFGSLFIDSSDFAGVQVTNTNIANLSTRGIDFAANYTLDLFDVGLGGWGIVNLNYVSTVLFELSTTPVPGVTTKVECQGLYGGRCGTPNPEYRHRLLTTWQTPWDIDISATWRFYGGADFDTGQSMGDEFSPTGNVLDDHLDSANYLDIGAQFYVREDLTLRTGVQNVFGRDPELSTQTGAGLGNGNTYPGIYDPAGRFIFVGLTLRL